MAKYQSKYHKYICEGFRWISFFSLFVTVLLFVTSIWFEFIPKEVVTKTFVTTLCLLVAAGVTKIIFAEKEDRISS